MGGSRCCETIGARRRPTGSFRRRRQARRRKFTRFQQFTQVDPWSLKGRFYYKTIGVEVEGAGYLAAVTLHLHYYKVHDTLSGERGHAPTWMDGAIGAFLGDTGEVVSQLSLLLNRFLVEYLRVNEAACSWMVGMAAPSVPPRTISKPKPPPPKRVAEAVPEAYKFDTDRIAELIDKTPREPLDQPLTLSEVDSLKTQIERCWPVQAGARYAEDLVVTIRIFLNPDGSLRREPQIVDDERLAGDPFFRVAAESAIRAV